MSGTALESHTDIEHGEIRQSSGFARIVSPRLRPLAHPLLAAVALVIWGLSLRHVDVSKLGSYGLPPVLPIAWYLALFLAVGGAVTAMTARRTSALMIVAYVAVIATMLYATVPVLSAQPHYAWVYKHIGVVLYLEEHGKANPSVDIYNRWPGFFAIAAMFSRVTGRYDPETYAGWAELFFSFLDAVLVMAAVKIIARETRIAAGAAVLFLVTNWVGQTYYSPQAFTFVLGLAMAVILLRQLRVEGTSYSKRLTRLIERVGRAPQLPLQAHDTLRWPRWVAITAITAIDAVVVASHQLTPYMILVSTTLLILVGVVRPWWIIVGMAVMTFAYLGANFSFIHRNYGLLNSIDPFNNVQVAAYTQTPSAGKAFNTRAELLAIVCLWLGGLWAAIRLLRRGLLIRALPFAVLAISPFAVIFGQNYGGEASLRIILFSSPWLSALISWALTTVTRRRLKFLLAMATTVVFAALFVVAFFGQEELNIISPAEARAGRWFYAHAQPGSVLVLAAPGFPFKYGGAYYKFRGPEGDAFPNLLSAHSFQNRQLGAAEIPEIIGRIREYSPYGYIAFTKDETAFAQVLRVTPVGAMAHLEAAVARSPDFRLWYGDQDAHIYELVKNRETIPRSPEELVPAFSLQLVTGLETLPKPALAHPLRQAAARRFRGRQLRHATTQRFRGRALRHAATRRATRRFPGRAGFAQRRRRLLTECRKHPRGRFCK